MTVTVKTDNKWRDLVYRSDVPAKILAKLFSYQDAEEVLDGFFCYRGYWYHLDGFTACSMDELKGWDGYASDSFFSGILIKLSSDGEQVQIGSYYS